MPEHVWCPGHIRYTTHHMAFFLAGKLKTGPRPIHDPYFGVKTGSRPVHVRFWLLFGSRADDRTWIVQWSELNCYDCIEAAKFQTAQNEAETVSNQCMWSCSMPTHVPDKGSKCKGAVHRVCEAVGEAAIGWTAHGKTVLFCPTCQPDSSRETNIVASAANTESSTVNPVPPDESESSTAQTESSAAPKKPRNKREGTQKELIQRPNELNSMPEGMQPTL